MLNLWRFAPSLFWGTPIAVASLGRSVVSSFDVAIHRLTDLSKQIQGLGRAFYAAIQIIWTDRVECKGLI